MRSSYPRLPAALALALLALSGTARTTSAQVPASEYASRRAALLAGIDSGVVVAFGAVEPVNYWPTFYQHPAFYYLTGFGESDAALVMVKRNGSIATSLFVPYRDPIRERWLGARTRITDLETRTGMPGRDIAELRATIDSLAGDLPFYVIPDDQTGDFADADSLTRGKHFVAQLRLAHPWLVVHSLGDAADRQRARKSAAEIALLRKAAEISVRGHTEAMKATAPGCGENEIQALLDGTFAALARTGPDTEASWARVRTPRCCTTWKTTGPCRTASCS